MTGGFDKKKSCTESELHLLEVVGLLKDLKALFISGTDAIKCQVLTASVRAHLIKRMYQNQDVHAHQSVHTMIRPLCKILHNYFIQK